MRKVGIRGAMLVGWVGAVLCQAGCSSPTAMIIEVTVDSTMTGTATYDHLGFTVGVAEHGDAASGALYVKDVTSSSIASVAGRDLTANPYRLYVASGLPNDGPVAVGVMAYADATTPAAFGYIGP